ncbi:PAS domain S-box protein [Mucilaginibacter sp. AW1-3]
MALSIFRLSNASNDKDFYRLFFVILCFINLAFHFLYLDYAPQSYDPAMVRVGSSLLCLITAVISFFDQKKIYYTSAYVTLLVFLGINNCYLLGENNFIGEYFLGSLVSLMVLSFFCRRSYEFVGLTLFNFIAFGCGLFFSTIIVELNLMGIALILFTGFAATLFLFRRSYILRSIKINNDVKERSATLNATSTELEMLKTNLRGLSAANTALVFEYDAGKTCVGEWYQTEDILLNQPETLIGTNINTLQIPVLTNYFKHVQKTHQQASFEFYSLFGNEQWYRAVINPVFDEERHFTHRVTVTITDITELKVTAAALKENELILYNEQVVAKLGSWWTDSTYKDIFWSNNLFSILEVSDIPPDKTKLSYYISLIHDDDRPQAQQYFASLASNPLTEFEHRLITPKGHLKYIKVVSGYPVKDDKGAVIKVAGIVQDITESKQANRTIRSSQAELMEVQAIAKVGGWKWDVKVNDLEWSDEIYRIYDLEKEEVKNENHFKLLLAFVHPDDKAMVSSLFKDHTKLNRLFLEYRIITGKGNLKYISIIIGKTLKKDGVIRKIIGTIQDLTERRKIEIDFERAENKYKNVLETINLAAVTLNKQGDIIFCNKHLADIVGYDKSELLGMNWIDSFVPDNLKSQFKAWLDSNSFYTQHTSPVICKNGKQRVINWKNTVTHDEFGNMAETTSIGEDITDIKKAREALIIAKENAEKSSRFKSEFLSIMSHEIRTPMNAVIGTTNLLLQDNPAPRQLEYLHTLQFSSNNLLELINDILDYNKIEAGKLELYKQQFNIQKLAQNILQAFATKAEDNGSKLELAFDKNIPANLIGDQLRLGQILNNLLSNAVKFTTNGTVYLRLESQQIKQDRISIRFAVADTGIGIAPENLDKIFDPFTQEYSSTASDYGGTGLGLAITKRLVELHGSAINLSSKPGEGTEFSFTIMFEKAEVDEPAEPITGTPAVTEHQRPEEVSIKGMSILLVDDNKMNLLIANKFLKNWNCKVQQASDGRMAVEMAMAHNFDLILMDLQMPLMDGFEAAALIKQSQPDIPIIALSADAMPETSAKAARYGMDDYLTKPFVPEVLFEKLARFYGKVKVEQ